MIELTKRRFEVHAQSLGELLSRGRYQKDKGKHFFHHKGRDHLFRLEALCRMYREGEEKKFFSFWYREFKALEDMLGSMDHNLSMYQRFSDFREYRKSAEKIFLKRFDEEAQFLSATLVEQQWSNGQKLAEFVQGINEFSFVEEQSDREFYAAGMQNELNKLIRKYESGELDPAKLESGMHEFRRRLRWISIYAAASDGLVQLKRSVEIPQEIAAYCTEEIAKSPFNLLPAAHKGQTTIQIRSCWFYYLSWLILRLSELKDTGLVHESYNILRGESGIKNREIEKQFLSSLKFKPSSIYELAENEIDRFIYTHQIPTKICRDLKRAVL